MAARRQDRHELLDSIPSFSVSLIIYLIAKSRLYTEISLNSFCDSLNMLGREIAKMVEPAAHNKTCSRTVHRHADPKGKGRAMS
jgi:hypothetical protein